MWTCRLMSSRAPNAPPTPPSTRRTSLGRQPEAGGDLLAILVQPLRGDVQLDAGAVVVGDGERRLEAEERLVLHAELVGALDHDVAGGLGVAAHDALAAQQVAVGMDRRVIAGDRHLGIEQRLEHLVLHHDRGEGPPAGLGVIGGDDRHRLADVPHDAVGEHRLVGGDQPVGELAGHVGGGEHHVHAGDRQRRARVERHDLGVRVRRAQRRSPHRTVERQVAGEGERTLHLGHPVGPQRGVADAVRPLDASA